ncbi:YitT family protein [Brevibacillus dissolubilis]|uniref:YitT family protein n=1 Tax=Brevibacillus dissolubilis TaxID=1844116 RepID=UPI0011171CD5|nr:YitT family protein [Brevibacillus dissolubilis]
MLKKTFIVILGSLLVAIGVNMFLVAQKLMDGGMIGVGLLAKYYLGLSPGWVMILASVPIYIWVFVYDRNLFYHSLHGLLLSSFFIDLLSPMRAWSDFPVPFAVVLGGTTIGAGIGIMLAYDTNTGGTDLVAQFISKRTKIPVALLIFLIDGVIISAAFWAIGPSHTFYSLVTILAAAVATHYFCEIEKGEQWESVPLSAFLRKK